MADYILRRHAGKHPAEITRPAHRFPPVCASSVNESRAHEHRRGHTVFEQERQSEFDHVGPAVIENDPDGIGWQLDFAFEMPDDSCTAEWCVLGRERPKLPIEGGGVGDTVIGEHAQPIPQHAARDARHESGSKEADYSLLDPLLALTCHERGSLSARTASAVRYMSSVRSAIALSS